MFIDRWLHSSILNSSPAASSIGEVGEGEREGGEGEGGEGEGEGDGGGGRGLTRRLNVNETSLDKQV